MRGTFLDLDLDGRPSGRLERAKSPILTIAAAETFVERGQQARSRRAGPLL